jgi:hypothetical protein
MTRFGKIKLRVDLISFTNFYNTLSSDRSAANFMPPGQWVARPPISNRQVAGPLGRQNHAVESLGRRPPHLHIYYNLDNGLRRY